MSEAEDYFNKQFGFTPDFYCLHKGVIMEPKAESKRGTLPVCGTGCFSVLLTRRSALTGMERTNVRVARIKVLERRRLDCSPALPAKV